MAQQNKSNSLTEGSVARGMLLFAIPIFISNLFQQLYNAADSLIVGNFLGGEALAAVGSSGSLIFLLTGFVNGVALGAGVLIARYFGAKDWESLEKAIHTTVALGLAAGAVLTVVGVILTPQILHWMGTPEDVIGNSVAYFRTYFLGSIAVVMYNVGASILQSVGNSRSPMKYLITASLINIVLDLLFIGVLGYGVAAAAFATIISQSVSAILAFSKLMRSKEAWAVSWRKVRFDGPMLHGVICRACPPASRTRSSRWQMLLCRQTSTRLAHWPWPGAALTARWKVLLSCRSPAFRWHWPLLSVRMWVRANLTACTRVCVLA